MSKEGSKGEGGGILAVVVLELTECLVAIKELGWLGIFFWMTASICWCCLLSCCSIWCDLTMSNYLTKTIDGELIDINKLEMNEMNRTKSIVSKREDITIYIYIYIPIHVSVKECDGIQTAALLVTH